MTLFKQLALVISTITLITLGSVLYINYASAKQDMIENLYQTTVNNIETLTNNLAESEGEVALLSATVDAAFDSGYYKKIKFSSSDKLFEYEQIDNEPVEGVPAWFINFTNIELKSVTSDVSSGWNIIGEVEVIGDSGIIYQALYKMFIKLLYLFALLSLLSLLILSILLHFVLKPLKDIQNQAEAIMKNEFVIQKNEPYTTEFKDVVHGMNSMVKKVEDIFNKANESAKRNRELLYNDPVTKLYNRRYLMLKLADLMQLENRIDGGSVIFVALSSVERINTLIGRQNCDALLESFAQTLQKTTKKYEESLAARVNQTEFTLILCNCESTEALVLAKEINSAFLTLLHKYTIEANSLTLSMGLYRYRPSVTPSELLTRADSALAKAKINENSNIYLYEESEQKSALGKEQWREIITEALSKQHFKLKFWPVVDTKSQTIAHQLMTFTIDDGKEKRYFYGDFIAPAINLGVVGKIYMVALKNLLTIPQNKLEGRLCCVRLSNEFLKDVTALQELALLLEKSANRLNFKLSFEISDTFASHNKEIVKSFIELFHRQKIGFGLNAFTSDSQDLSYLKELNPDFIKADVSFLLDQSQDSMSALQVVTDSLGIEIIASFVKTKEELEQLQTMHIHKVQGPITDALAP